MFANKESWNPMWSVATILLGFHSFMLDKDATMGSIEATSRQRKLLASKSLAFNVRDKQFCECFPHLVEKYEEIQRQNQLNGTSANVPGASSASATNEDSSDRRERQEISSSTLVFSLGISVVILALVLKLCS
jgi:ubiquitin-conjugating enzyme E2 J2